MCMRIIKPLVERLRENVNFLTTMRNNQNVDLRVLDYEN